MTAQQMMDKAEKLERDADTLYMSLLAPSMAERTMREEANAIRQGLRCEHCGHHDIYRTPGYLPLCGWCGKAQS